LNIELAVGIIALSAEDTLERTPDVPATHDIDYDLYKELPPASAQFFSPSQIKNAIQTKLSERRALR
jgi:hypothetical protein